MSSGITPEEAHSSHDVREEGILISDPCCQRCRASAVQNADALRGECPGSFSKKQTVSKLKLYAHGDRGTGKSILLEAALRPLVEAGIVKTNYSRGRINTQFAEEIEVEILDITKLLQLSGRV